MECPYCHKEIPQDSMFVIIVGKNLTEKKKRLKNLKN